MTYQLITIYVFVSDFMEMMQSLLLPLACKPGRGCPPIKRSKMRLVDRLTLGIFFSLSGFDNYADYYRFLHTYHTKDFPHLPTYQNFESSLIRTTPVAHMMLNIMITYFQQQTPSSLVKFADSSRLKVCDNQRILSHKVAAQYASRGKTSRGWFFGFKLHIICNQMMDILGVTFTDGSTDDREGLQAIWEDIC